MQWSEYDESSGEFTGNQVTHNINGLQLPQREGRSWIAGCFHPDTHSVEAGSVIERRSSQPSCDHEWDQQMQRWELSATALSRMNRRNAGLSRMRELDAASIRAMREVSLGEPGPGALRLAAIESELKDLRAELAAIDAEQTDTSERSGSPR